VSDYKPITVYILNEKLEELILRVNELEELILRVNELEKELEELGRQWEEVPGDE
jgi:predicted aspartyl protease